MSASPVKPTSGKVADLVKLSIAGIYVVAPLALMVYRLYQGQSVDSVILLVVIMFMVASGYVVFGEKAVEKAQKTASEISTDGGEE